MSEETEGKHGVQSLEIGMGILRAMVNGQRSMMLKEIAAAAGMPASKAHRYLVSLIRAGLVEQDVATSRYNLGPFALNIGLVAIDRLDRVRLGLTAIADLRDQINETTALAVWGETGPVIIRWERPRRPITVNVITGANLQLLSTASGRVFSAWMPRSLIDPLIAKEMKKRPLPDLPTKAEVDAMLATVRRTGIAAIDGNYMVQGVQAAAAPVFNFKNELTMALVVVGVEGMFNIRPESPVIEALKTAADALSTRLGATRGASEA